MSPQNGNIPRGDTGRTFFVPEPAVTGSDVQVSPPSGVLQVSTSQTFSPVWRERYTVRGSSWSSVMPPL